MLIEASAVRVVHIYRGIGESGGAVGVALSLLHQRLLRLGIDSKMLVLDDAGTGPDVSRLPRVETLSLERRIRAVTRRLGLNDIHRLGSFRLDRHTFFQNADLVHFHGMHSGTFSYLALPRVATFRPTLLSLHDTWAFTGHCAYPGDCERWKTGCGECPSPETDPAIARDATHLEWRLKSRAFNASGLGLVSKSAWTTRVARVSALRHLPLTEIPYGVDTAVYRPRGKGRSRALLGLPQELFVLLVSGSDMKERRAGQDLLARSLRALAPDLAARCVLMVMGRGGSELGSATGLPVRDLGYVSDDHLRAVAFSASDLYLLPTRADVFGIASIESQACGTPVVSFRVGGVPDHVRPGETGFLAEPEDALGFRDGIALLLENEAARHRLSAGGRASVLRDFDLSLEASRHASLYEAILSGRKVGAGRPPVVPPIPLDEPRFAARPAPRTGGSESGTIAPVAEPAGPD
ncbi:MAG: glycosyltransferase [Candidatus Palauibacterales bacterium]|nr:glycosyltransferase [Candidatus Palauibacterales bacterium]MDP2483842.1 glycosyltransferase [Candidatus Palauibacterales bacterium]